LAGILVETRRFEAAEHELARAHSSLERGPDPSAVAAVDLGFGDLYAARGELESARSSYERALAIFEQTLHPEHPNVATSLYKLGSAHEQLDELGQARELYECALEIRTTARVSPIELADVRFALARVLAVEEPMRARALVEQALADYATVEHAADALADAQVWLDQHPG
jgi:tetratricopeptide (TPR) repeat protein